MFRILLKDVSDNLSVIAQKVKFSIKDFFSKCDRNWSYLLKKSLMKNLFIIIYHIKIEIISYLYKCMKRNLIRLTQISLM